jgi:DNA-damage-inducible protein D
MTGHTVADHFVDITEMVAIGSGAQRPIEDWRLSRYACYLIIQNAEPSKPLVTLGQTYLPRKRGRRNWRMKKRRWRAGSVCCCARR